MKNILNLGLGLCLVASVLSCASCTSAATIDRSSASVEKFKGRVIEFESGPEGFNTKTFFFEGESEVVAFDAQFTPQLAQQSIAKLRQVTDKPISWLVITHPNPDKFNGASVFKAAGAKVIASQAAADAIPGVQAYKEYYFVQLAKMFQPGTYPQPSAVDETFVGSRDLVLNGGETIRLKELAMPGVSSTQTVASIPSLNALVVGDLVHFKAHAWLEGGIVNGKPTPTLGGWVADLLEIQALYPINTRVYGGRGEAGPLKTVVDAQIQYLQKADQLVGDYIKSLGGNRTELVGDQAQTHYQKLQLLFEQTFPDYKLGYMIGYGIYGLIDSKI